MPASTYLKNQIVTHFLRSGTWTKPPALYVALFTVAPTDAGGGTEVAGGAYARVSVNPADANWTAPSGDAGQSVNVSTIAYPTPTASWGTAVAWALFDAATGGNMLEWNALGTPQAIASGVPVQFNAGALAITVS